AVGADLEDIFARIRVRRFVKSGNDVIQRLSPFINPLSDGRTPMDYCMCSFQETARQASDLVAGETHDAQSTAAEGRRDGNDGISRGNDFLKSLAHARLTASAGLPDEPLLRRGFAAPVLADEPLLANADEVAGQPIKGQPALRPKKDCRHHDGHEH